MSCKLPTVVAPLPGSEPERQTPPNDSQPNRKDSVTTMVKKLEARLDMKLGAISKDVNVDDTVDATSVDDALPAKIILYRDILERAKRLYSMYSWKDDADSCINNDDDTEDDDDDASKNDADGTTTTTTETETASSAANSINSYQILSKEFQDLIEAYEYLMGERELFEKTFSNYKNSSNLKQSHCLLTIDSCPSTLLDDPMQWDSILRNGCRDYQQLHKELEDLKERNLFLKDSLITNNSADSEHKEIEPSPKRIESLQQEVVRLHLQLKEKEDEERSKEERDLYLRNTIVNFMKLGSDNKSELFSLLKELLCMSDEEVDLCKKATAAAGAATSSHFSFMNLFS